MGIKYYRDLIQGSPEWLEARRGLLATSEMKLILTPTLKIASNDKERAHLYELLAQRISGYVEPSYIGDDMLRGMESEILARQRYAERYAPVEEIGFITNDKWGFKIGYSPDGLVGKTGAIEVKGPRQKSHVETILNGVVPVEHVLQIQTGMMVAELEWIDFISYHGGLPMVTIRAYPDPVIQSAIVEAATSFEAKLGEKLREWKKILAGEARLIPTERVIEQEMFV